MGSIVAALPASGRPDTGLAERMIDAAPHRGTRFQAVTHGGSALAISCSGTRADTSLVVHDGVAIAFSGVLDNLGELAQEVGLAAERGAPDPATVLAKLHQRYGEDAPRRLRGIFAAIVSDGRRLVCFRDQLGFGPLFYRHDRDGCYVATEAKQVVAGSGITKEPDLAVLEQIFYQRYDDQMPSALRGVQRLPKASILVAEPSGTRLWPYWVPASLLETARPSALELRSRFDELMTQAVARCLTGSDVISLSGGIDSPAVAAFAGPEHLRKTGRPLPAVSQVYPDFPNVDERRYVDLVAQDLDLSLTTYQQQTNPLKGLRQWVEIADGPIPRVGVSLYEEHYRHVRDLGYQTILTGELAEFVFDTRNYLVTHLLLHWRLEALLKYLRSRRARGAPLKSIARQLASTFVPTPITAARLRRDRTAAPDWVDLRKANEAAARSLVPGRQRWSKLQLGAFIGPGVSMEADDVCQELCGVRTRRPWADVDLWEFFLSLPAEIKFPDAQSKGLMRQLLRGKVPDPILDRRDKTYFDDSIASRIDYPGLSQWLTDTEFRMDGVDYVRLRDRLERRAFKLVDLAWAMDLAGVHAFLSQWERSRPSA
jgi:asparagine synthase (glutamine-hydrolysing)